jgi:hypothetical protein
MEERKMTESIGLMPAGPTAPPATLALLGARPLIRGEDAASYDALLARICGTLRPSDSLEEIWIRDVVDLVWETFRLRRIKANLLTYRTQSQIRGKLIGGFDNADEMACSWATGDEAEAKEVEEALLSVGSSLETAMALSVWAMLDEVERLDRMLVSVEARRSAALRELDYHRGPLARKLRRTIADVEQSEFADDAPRIAEQTHPA